MKRQAIIIACIVTALALGIGAWGIRCHYVSSRAADYERLIRTVRDSLDAYYRVHHSYPNSLPMIDLSQLSPSTTATMLGAVSYRGGGNSFTLDMRYPSGSGFGAWTVRSESGSHWLSR